MDKIVRYDNELVDRFLFTNYKSKMLDLFFALILKVQKEKNTIKFNRNEIKNLIKTSNLTSAEFTEILKTLSSQTIRYKVTEDLIENDDVIAKKGDFIWESIFERLIEEKTQEYITIQIKDKFKWLFFDLKDNFSKHELDEIMNINSKYSKILFMFLNRWRNYNKAVFVEWDNLLARLGTPASYKTNDIIRTLDKSKEEINGKTGLKFDYKTVKRGRKIEKIVFTINDYIKEIEDMLKDPNINSTQKKALEMILKRETVGKKEQLS